VDRPIRFAVYDMPTKLAFRILRSGAMFSADGEGLEAIVDYVIKMMAHMPGLSRERILAQFSREYGYDVTEKVEHFQGLATENGYAPGTSILEVMSKQLVATMPLLMKLYKKG
jgi:hypothetical protein